MLSRMNFAYQNSSPNLWKTSTESKERTPAFSESFSKELILVTWLLLETELRGRMEARLNGIHHLSLSEGGWAEGGLPDP